MRIEPDGIEHCPLGMVKDRLVIDAFFRSESMPVAEPSAKPRTGQIGIDKSSAILLK